MNQLAWILKRVYKITIWRNPDSTYGADVTYTKTTEPVVFEEQTIEWLVREIERSLIAIQTEA
jgi:hypothetical protein